MLAVPVTDTHMRSTYPQQCCKEAQGYIIHTHTFLVLAAKQKSPPLSLNHNAVVKKSLFCS